SIIPQSPTSTLFPYTTLFRSAKGGSVIYRPKLETPAVRPATVKVQKVDERHPVIYHPPVTEVTRQAASTSRQTTPSSTSRRGERSEEHTSELQSLAYLVCRLL